MINLKILNEQELLIAKKELDKGNLVIFPTETVYGLGANALDSTAVDKIFKTKNRASNNPLIVHLKNKEEIGKYAIINNDIERLLIDKFMPGPFTLILQKKDIIPSNVTCNMDTVGIRIPIDPIAHELLDMLDYPIAAPSANVSTKPSGTRVVDIINEFERKVNYIIDGGESRIGLESTVCKVIDGIPTILRPGFITKEDIMNAVGIVKVDDNIFKKVTGKVESPGMKYRHYAPSSKSLLICSQKKDELINCFKENATKDSVIIGSSKLKNIACKKYLYYGDTLEEISHNIFKLLRLADTYKPDIILIEGVNKNGLGLAIMNRLVRACSYNYIER